MASSSGRGGGKKGDSKAADSDSEDFVDYRGKGKGQGKDKGKVAAAGRAGAGKGSAKAGAAAAAKFSSPKKRGAGAAAGAGAGAGKARKGGQLFGVDCVDHAVNWTQIPAFLIDASLNFDPDADCGFEHARHADEGDRHIPLEQRLASRLDDLVKENKELCIQARDRLNSLICDGTQDDHPEDADYDAGDENVHGSPSPATSPNTVPLGVGSDVVHGVIGVAASAAAASSARAVVAPAAPACAEPGLFADDPESLSLAFSAGRPSALGSLT
jgi:hypothetical protein